MKETAEVIDRLFSQIGTFLRYIAPGFVALFVVAAVITATREFLSTGSPVVVALGILLGPIIYGLHTAALVRVLWFLIVFLHKDKIHKSTWNAMKELDFQRWLRRASEDSEVRLLQAEMDKWGSMLNFLYCLSYSMILIPLVTKWFKPCLMSSNWTYIVLGGCFVLIATLISENRCTHREIDLKTKYPDGKSRPKSN